MNRYQFCFGLLEVMIALVVFAIGVVGMAGLQLRTLSMSIDSTQRSIVIAKSQDLADRIRSSGAAPGDYVGTYNNSMCPASPANVCADTGTTDASACNAAQMVTFDVWEVFCGNRSGLDNGVLEWSTVISCAGGCPANGAQVTITTTWDSRVADTNKEIADSNVSNADGSQESTLTDSLSLSFIP